MQGPPKRPGEPLLLLRLFTTLQKCLQMCSASHFQLKIDLVNLGEGQFGGVKDTF